MNSLNATPHFRATLDSPVGALSLVATDRALVALVWRQRGHRACHSKMRLKIPQHPVLRETARQLREYFAGARRSSICRSNFAAPISSVASGPRCSRFPTAKRARYGQIAEQIGNPAAVRAVGAANGRNPISIIAPCHRVIGMSGDLTGFGGGLDAKACLLSLEAPQRQLLAG